MEYVGMIVTILHCGGQKEKDFIKFIADAADSLPTQNVVFEYRTYQEKQHKDVLMYTDAQKYHKEQGPLIVLISQDFFNLIWPTAYKNNILNIITDYSTQYCLHVWLDLDSKKIKQYNSKLCNERITHFRRVESSSLMGLNAEPLIKKVSELLFVKDTEERLNLNNFAIDDNNENYSKSMKDLHRFQLMQIAQYLARGPGANWRQLAESFGFRDFIETFINEIPKESSTNEYSRCLRFLEFLIMNKEDLTFQDFVRKCREISREDVAKYIEQI